MHLKSGAKATAASRPCLLIYQKLTTNQLSNFFIFFFSISNDLRASMGPSFLSFELLLIFFIHLSFSLINPNSLSWSASFRFCTTTTIHCHLSTSAPLIMYTLFLINIHIHILSLSLFLLLITNHLLRLLAFVAQVAFWAALCLRSLLDYRLSCLSCLFRLRSPGSIATVHHSHYVPNWPVLLRWWTLSLLFSGSSTSHKSTFAFNSISLLFLRLFRLPC